MKKFKICTKCKCKKIANLINFKPNKGTKDKLTGCCRKCKQEIDRIYSRKYRKSNPAWKKMDNKRNSSLQSKLIRKYQKEFPEKIRAQVKARKAKRDGKLKQEPCIVCGSKKSEMHHPNYNLPYKVIWLCHLHHKQLHFGIITLKKFNK